MAAPVDNEAAPIRPTLEQRLAQDEARLIADEARIEAEEAAIREGRIVSWFGVGLAVVLAIAVAALIMAVIALREDVGSISRSAPDGSVATAALRDGSVTAEKLAADAVGSAALGAGAVAAEHLSADAVTGAKVAPNSLTGSDIVERELKTVPSALNAAHLGGVPAHAYLSRVFDVSAGSATDRSMIKGPVSATCPRGSRVISGGATIDGAARGAAIVTSAPTGGAGWTATARVARRAQPQWRLVVTAICAVGGE